MQKRVNDFWREKVGAYIMQGDYLALHMEEQSCLTWKSFMWDIPQGVLKFAINAGINTLPLGFVVMSKPWRTFSPTAPLLWTKDVLLGATTPHLKLSSHLFIRKRVRAYPYFLI